MCAKFRLYIGIIIIKNDTCKQCRSKISRELVFFLQFLADPNSVTAKAEADYRSLDLSCHLLLKHRKIHLPGLTLGAFLVLVFSIDIMVIIQF